MKRSQTGKGERTGSAREASASDATEGALEVRLEERLTVVAACDKSQNRYPGENKFTDSSPLVQRSTSMSIGNSIIASLTILSLEFFFLVLGCLGPNLIFEKLN